MLVYMYIYNTLYIQASGMSLVRERTDRSRNRSRRPNLRERLQKKENKNKKIKNLNSD